MATTTYANNDIEISADFARAESTIYFRSAFADDEEEGQGWQPTPFQVADARHDPERALRMVDEWAEA